MTSPSEVTCPACQAPPASPCNVPTDRSRRGVPWYHHAREDSARRVDDMSVDDAPHQMTLAEAIPFWDDWNPGIEHDLAAMRAGRTIGSASVELRDLPGKSGLNEDAVSVPRELFDRVVFQLSTVELAVGPGIYQELISLRQPQPPITTLVDRTTDALTQIYDDVRSIRGVSPELITEFTTASNNLIARLNEGE